MQGLPCQLLDREDVPGVLEEGAAGVGLVQGLGRGKSLFIKVWNYLITGRTIPS